MSLDNATLDHCAVLLRDAEREVREVHKLTDDHPGLDVADAYRIQQRLCSLKQAEGVRIVGMKMGLTSHAKMQQMGVDTPIYGFLGSDNAVDDGAVVDTRALIHPKVEAEIAFVMREALHGPGCTAADVLAATDYVVPAIELIDSRYENFRFDLPSVIADNTSASRYVLGSRPTEVSSLDLQTLGVVLEKNGQVAEVGAGAAVLGDPAAAVAMLVNMLAGHGQPLAAGSVVLSGAITAAIAVAAGDNVQVRADGIGTVSMRFI
ncbi:2-oxo-3-hexenedioate decarboxylase [Stenotrophomonas sp. ISL-67]|uniref:2-oxo-3-hexenedioate decarboxylase n=1 Tax=Stenotrophomonas sp. ISL-67 TaxID=2819171 RepID=UPI001BE9C40A|nr:2-oxo-3-hexenedioate decarboxylase [Stenotrophomonas sp. ISL-67]MBT2766840.1 2-oxo-3-hexenedioate decarboxylase [Stenotrophomonas sp. ISL-67]